MVTEREAWLAQTIEDPIEPEIPLCDPHHHLWDLLNNHYLLEDFLRDIGGGNNIVQTVFLECLVVYRNAPYEMSPVGETEFVEGIANQSASGQYGKTRVAAGIVGFADLTLGAAVAPVLEAHIAASPTRFRGIRHANAWDASFQSHMSPNRELLLNPRFREGFAYLQKYGLSFDAWMYHRQLMELVDLARAFPGTTIILDHVGSPIAIGPYAGNHEAVLQEWRSGLVELATCPNVFLKLGGLGIPFCGFGWSERPVPPGSAELAETMAPYFLWCIEQFGTDRCMFESNFPVDKFSYSYTAMWNAFKLITKDFSPGDRASLLHDTAARVYRL